MKDGVTNVVQQILMTLEKGYSAVNLTSLPVIIITPVVIGTHRPMSFLSAILRVVSHFRENRGEERKISKRASVTCEQRYREPLVARASEDAFESCVMKFDQQ